MRDVIFHYDLKECWRQAVSAGQVVSMDTDTGAEIGLCLIGDKPVFYEARPGTGTFDLVSMPEREIGEGFTVKYHKIRGLNLSFLPVFADRFPIESSAVSECGFHCGDLRFDNSILRRDPLMHIFLKNWRWNVYCNLIPAEEEGHFLWIPALVNGTQINIPHLPQEFNLELVEDALSIYGSLDSSILYFNSLSAGASVNHFHLHSVASRGRTAIEQASVSLYRNWFVLADYRANGIVFDLREGTEKIFSGITRFQQRQIPFSFIFIADRVFFLPRNPEKGIVLSALNMAGRLTVKSKNDYDQLDLNMVSAIFKQATLPLKAMLSVLS